MGNLSALGFLFIVSSLTISLQQETKKEIIMSDGQWLDATEENSYYFRRQNFEPGLDIDERDEAKKQLREISKSDHRVPKRPLSASFWFSNDLREKIWNEHPELSVTAIFKEMGRLWLAADPETKAKYEAIAAQDQERYEKESAAYNLS